MSELKIVKYTDKKNCGLSKQKSISKNDTKFELNKNNKTISIVSVWPLTKASFGGTEKFVTKLAESLDQEKNKVECLSPSKNNYYCGFVNYQIQNPKLKRINEFVIRKLMDEEGVEKTIKLFSDSLMSLIRKKNKRNNLFVINSPFFCLIDKKISSVFVLHDNPNELINYFGEKNAEEILDVFKKNISFPIVTPSEHYQKIYSQKLGIKVKDIPHCIDSKTMEKINMFLKINKTSEKKQKIITIIIPSRLEPNQKGQDVAIKAMSSVIKQTKKNIVLKMSGLDPAYKQQATFLKKMASDLGVKIKINKYGDIIKEIARADIVLVPSRYESFGYAALESLALGKQVILSDIPTYQQISKDAPNANLFKSESVVDLTKIILKTLRTKNDNKSPSLEWYRKYSPNLWVKKYLDLFE